MRHLILVCAVSALMWPAHAGAAEPAQEKAMAQRIAGALRESGELSNYRVGVKFEEGVAWLIGSVTSPDQAEAAQRLASEVEGVKHVVNRLEVAPAAAEIASTAPAETPADDAGVKLAATLDSLPVLPEAKPRVTPEVKQVAAATPTGPRSARKPKELPPTPAAKMAQQAPQQVASRGMPRPMRPMAPVNQVQPANYGPQYGAPQYGGGMPTPQGYSTGGAAGVSYDQANMPNYAWPSYAAYPNYSAVTYPQQYSPSAWPYIGPFYPYPQVPLGWRKVTLEWDDGWWYLDFSHHKNH